MARWTRLNQIILSAAFIIIIVIMGVTTMISSDRDLSKVENRNLAQKPDLSLNSLLSGSYYNDYELYFSDQLFQRDFLVKEYTMLQLKLNKTIINGTVIGKDGWLLQEPVGAKATRLLDEVAGDLNTLGDWLDKRDTPLFFALAPHKVNILSDKYPDYFRKSRGYINREYLVGELDPKINYINLTEHFLSNYNNNDIEGMYFKTDHHWNGRGAQAALPVIISQIDEKLKNSHETNIEYVRECDDSSSFTGSYNQKIFGLIDSNEEFKCRFISVNSPHLISFSAANYKGDLGGIEDVFGAGINLGRDEITYSGIFSADLVEIKFEYENPGDINLLILKDSYANPIIPNIAEHYSKTYVLDLRHYKEKNVYQYIEDNNINAVLILHNDINLMGEMYKFK
ncbi:DHHW family protein [Paenibacillus sp. YSY-4.3]